MLLVLIKKYFNLCNHAKMVLIREVVLVENIRLVRLLDLTADYEVKTNAKLTLNFKLREKSKPGFQSCLYTVTLTPNFA